MGLISRFRYWQAVRRERRIDILTAKAGDICDGQQYDLLFLHQRGVVRVKATGQSITRIYAGVENLIRKRFDVVVKPGTYFVSSGGHQNMVTTAEYSFTMAPCSKEHLNINAACINAGRPIPGEKDRFCGVARVPDEVARFLEASRLADPMVIQAGVWALTDGYSGHQVQTHLVSRDRYGNTRQAVSDSQVAEARKILNSLGIRHNL